MTTETTPLAPGTLVIDHNYGRTCVVLRATAGQALVGVRMKGTTRARGASGQHPRRRYQLRWRPVRDVRVAPLQSASEAVGLAVAALRFVRPRFGPATEALATGRSVSGQVSKLRSLRRTWEESHQGALAGIRAAAAAYAKTLEPCPLSRLYATQLRQLVALVTPEVGRELLTVANNVELGLVARLPR